MAKHKILVVDDLSDVADSLAELLSFFGHEVRCAYDGGQAIEVVGEFEPDIVILDINMPVADGYEVARVLRRMRDGKQFIIAMTGASSRETWSKAKAAGFDMHMVKPIPLDELADLLESQPYPATSTSIFPTAGDMV